MLPKFLFPKQIVTDFTIHNLPYGVFKCPKTGSAKIGVAIGDKIIDCFGLAQKGILPEFFKQPTLNMFMGQTSDAWREVRRIIQKELLSDDSSKSLKNVTGFDEFIVEQKGVEMLLPSNIGDYTDFYASREHATNVGKLFRPGMDALLPNWLHIPVGYHGRASSVVVSGTNIRRPWGQIAPVGSSTPEWKKCVNLDYEMEIGAFIGGPENQLGAPLTLKEAEDRLFGLVLLNDWSARDIQRWEYVPLGPFLGKNFGTTISPWVVPMEALEPFRVDGPAQVDPEPLQYLKGGNRHNAMDIELTCELKTANGATGDVCKTNLKYMYWTLAQQLTHHASNGCNMRPGDLIGTGTISGSTPESFGSLLERSWNGKSPLDLSDGSKRTFFQDNDIVTIRGKCNNGEIALGFGEATSVILPALESFPL